MKLTKNFKIIAYICIFTLVFNFSLARAEETTVTEDTSAPVTEEPAPSADPEQVPETTATEPATPPAETPAIEPETTISEIPAPAPEVLGQQETAGTDAPQPTQEQTVGDATTTEPIIFDFSGDNTATGENTNTSSGGSGATSPVCGNGLVESDEACDDGNLLTGDGCGLDCQAETPASYSLPTGFYRNIDIKELTLLAQWQMLTTEAGEIMPGRDDSPENGAQFLPTGKYKADKPITVCAAVADISGSGGLGKVTAQINYPAGAAKSVSAGGEKIGCGQEKINLELVKIGAEEAAAMVCDSLRNNNNNLAAWGSDKTNNLVYGYEHVCGQDGLLTRGAAELYCGQAFMNYDDPAGNYQVKVIAENNAGASVTGENNLNYLEITTFENDFTSMQYGLIRQGELKTVSGDNDFDPASQPTIRNTGNTRLVIKIWQNDFNLGMTDGDWNIEYRARLGSSAEFINYRPEQLTALNNTLELGQTENADFSVLVKRFPPTDLQTAFSGSMTLTADKAPALGCE